MTGAITRSPRLPRGWFATAAGGVIGTVVGGFLGLAISSAYVDSYQSDGLEGLGTMIVGTLASAWLGAVLGAALMLKLFGYANRLASGFVFAVLGVILLMGLGFIGQLVLPQPLHANFGLAMLCVISPLLAGILARKLTGDRTEPRRSSRAQERAE